MASDIAPALVAAAAAVIVAGVTYWSAKKRELDAEIRKEKLAHYKDFVVSLSGVVAGQATAEGRLQFARACNNLNLIAPQAVIKALQDFQHETRTSNPSPDRQRHDALMSKLFSEMRKDLGVAVGEKEDFLFGLWSSGTEKQ